MQTLISTAQRLHCLTLSLFAVSERLHCLTLSFFAVSQLASKEQYKENTKAQGESDAAQFLSDYQAGLEADRAAEAARRQRRIELKSYHLKQVRSWAYQSPTTCIFATSCLDPKCSFRHF